MVWMMPRRSTPLSGSRPWRATVFTRSASSSARRACATICSPASVRNTPRLPRSNSVHAEFLLEVLHRGRQARLADEAALGGLAEMARLGDGHHVPEFGQVS